MFEFIDSGFTTIISTVNLKYLEIEFLGEKLDKIISKEIELRCSDICGENGENHTFVINGQIYKFTMNFNIQSIEEKMNMDMLL